MFFTKHKEIPCNCGHLSVYQQQQQTSTHILPSSSSHQKYWLSMRELVQVMVHHQQENVIKRKGDGEVSLGVTLHLLFKVEIEDFSITPTINALN